MNKKALKYIKQSVFLSIGIILIWFSFSNSNLTFDKFWTGAKSMNYGYFAISAVFAMLSHYSRALRWKLLINSTGYHPKTKNVFASVLFMYASNIAIPRSGEIARCGTLYKYESIPIPQLLGTVFIERTFDLLTLFLFTGLLVFVQFELFSNLYFQSSLPGMIDSLLNNKTSIIILLIVSLILSGALFILRKKIFSLEPMNKIGKLLSELKKSILDVLKMKKKLSFLFHTAIIWIGYVAMFYICFFAFEPTSKLGLAAGLTAFIAGSFGMVAPTQGGAGAWQIMVILALTTLNITQDDAVIWANVAFVIMTITIAIAGLVSFAILPVMNKKQKLS
ncbi:MAG: hypothetical protein CMP63_04985 [Flavobacteriales bacterium]|nr:hypothetical protein [Flavobacteriales bacterium]|tara:strand:+ start:8358 stop:9362 length:1005 start_codon:yes stop_codon:yes gene_type:complete